MSLKSHISLLDLSKQFPFAIDNDVKKNICFAETLIISCGHYEGVVDVDPESEWSCTETKSTEVSQKSDENVFEIKDRVEEEAIPEESDEDDNFHIYFFPDCKKAPPVQTSKASLLIGPDGFPKINPAGSAPKWCTCVGSQGPCPCFTKLPCKCGAKTKKTCTCETAEHICICDEDDPKPVCTCRESKVCLCHPDNKPRPVCKCGAIEKPCICIPDKFPCPICVCTPCNCAQGPFVARACDCEQKSLTEIRAMISKPIKEVPEESKSSFFTGEGETVAGEIIDGLEEMVDYEEKPCLCQKPTPTRCFCLKEGRKCICNTNACICGVQNTCICELTDVHEPTCVHSHYEPKESISICSCPRLCTCDEGPSNCKCFPEKNCECRDPDNCICKKVCECKLPCICETQQNTGDECTVCVCARKEGVCTCPKDKKSDALKLKKVRAGKEGYRWCHQVNPRHTFFDYGYGMHDKIEFGDAYPEKTKILGFHYHREEEDACAVHGVKPPPFNKTIRQPSLDCCSTVGGISISVETLGNEEDKFLVHVVSHSSKEGSRTGSKLVSIVDCHLHTMEENRIEHITKRDITKERRSYMAICDSGYYNKVTRICGDHTVVKRLYHTMEDAHNFLLEGSNVLLMRYFGLRRFKGVVKTDTVMIGGEICESIYVSHGISQAVVNMKPMYVVKVERHIIEPNGNLHQTLTVISLRGYMISHEWADNCYVLHINPLLQVNPQKDLIEPHEPARERWRDDLQLFSDYLYMKSTRTSEGGRYVQENGALTGVVREYLQTILFLKPAETVHFTRHYFGTVLSYLNLPHNEYFDKGSKRVRYYFFEQ